MLPPNFLIPAGTVIKNAKTYVEKLFSWDIWPEAGSANYLTGLPVIKIQPVQPCQDKSGCLWNTQIKRLWENPATGSSQRDMKVPGRSHCLTLYELVKTPWTSISQTKHANTTDVNNWLLKLCSITDVCYINRFQLLLSQNKVCRMIDRLSCLIGL